MAAFFAAREGELQKRAGHHAKSIPPLEQALAYYAAETKKDPQNYSRQYITVIMNTELAGSHREIGNNEQAKNFAVNAVLGGRKLVGINTSNRGAKEQLARSLTVLSSVDRMIGDFGPSSLSAQEAISIGQTLLDEQPENEEALDIVIWAQTHMALTQIGRGDINSACKTSKVIFENMLSAKQFERLRPFTKDRIIKSLMPISDNVSCDVEIPTEL